MPLVLDETVGHVRVLTWHRPHRLNAITPELRPGDPGGRRDGQQRLQPLQSAALRSTQGSR
ncbi:MAG: hypothetical protein ABWX74_15830 [Aeromicrobium sp.]